MRSKRVSLSILCVTFLSLALSCEDVDYGLDQYKDDDLDNRASGGCLQPRNINWTYRSGDSLPLGQSRPGAKVTLFFDFDGGSYSGVSSGRVRSRYDSSERAHIERQIEQVAGNYARWSINVTTDKSVFERASKRGRIFIANGEGGSGLASTNGISSSSRYTGYVGIDTVFDSGSSGYKCAYVMTHEFGHNFTLRGTTEDYADMYPNATIGAFMGGRDRQFKGYRWIALKNKNGKWQDPSKIIGGIAGTVSDSETETGDNGGGDCHEFNPGHGSYCSSSCPCNVNEGDCDKDSDCKGSLICKQQSGTDFCQQPAGGSCELKCSPTCQCGWTESGCNTDRDCQSGLYCEIRPQLGNRCLKKTNNGGDTNNNTGDCHEFKPGHGSYCSSDCPCDRGEGDCDNDSQCKGNLVCKQQSGTDFCVSSDTTGGGGKIQHIGTTEKYDSNGQGLRISRPSGSKAGDLLILVLHRTDDDLPLYVDGWKRVAECFKKDNGYDCSTEKDCTSWHNSDFCGSFGGHGGHDLAQAVFYRKVGSSEPSSYTFDLNRDSSGHPGWAILTALRGAATSNPVRDWSFKGCDGSADSVFPSVYGNSGDMVLLSQSYDDAVSQSKFGAPSGTSTWGYVSQSDEAGFLFGGTLDSTGETGKMKTTGNGASSCKDALVSLTIKPQ